MCRCDGDTDVCSRGLSSVACASLFSSLRAAEAAVKLDLSQPQ